jgi:hypothetical protein
MLGRAVLPDNRSVFERGVQVADSRTYPTPCRAGAGSGYFSKRYIGNVSWRKMASTRNTTASLDWGASGLKLSSYKSDRQMVFHTGVEPRCVQWLEIWNGFAVSLREMTINEAGDKPDWHLLKRVLQTRNVMQRGLDGPWIKSAIAWRSKMQWAPRARNDVGNSGARAQHLLF